MLGALLRPRRPCLSAASLLALCVVLGCGKGGEGEGAPPGAAPALAPQPSARRPLKHYLARTADRCEVYAARGSELSPPAPAPCPAGLFVGERIRMAGRTCLRESPEAARQIPVICPPELVLAEEAERQDAGG